MEAKIFIVKCQKCGRSFEVQGFEAPGYFICPSCKANMKPEEITKHIAAALECQKKKVFRSGFETDKELKEE